MFYVDTINAEKAIGDGVNAMLARLDPYTEYIPEKEKDDFFLFDYRRICGYRFFHYGAG